MFKVDELWIILKIKRISHTGDIYRYLYLFDDDNEDNAGIVEFDRFVIEEIVEKNFEEYISQMYYDKRVVVVKEINNKKFITKNGVDFASIIALFFIYKEFLKNKEFLSMIEYLNLRSVEKLKNIFPEEYNGLMNIVESKMMIS